MISASNGQTITAVRNDAVAVAATYLVTYAQFEQFPTQNGNRPRMLGLQTSLGTISVGPAVTILPTPPGTAASAAGVIVRHDVRDVVIQNPHATGPINLSLVLVSTAPATVGTPQVARFTIPPGGCAVMENGSGRWTIYDATGVVTNECCDGAGGSGALGHHYSYPAVYYTVYPTSSPINVGTGLVHWPGWTVADEVHWNNSLNAYLGSPTSWVRETDATSGRRVTAVRAVTNIEEASPFEVNLYRGIPEYFTGWDVQGLTIQHRVVFSATPTTETFTITAEVYDPTNAGDVVAATVSRVVTANDAGYVDLTVPQAALNSAGFSPGDMLRLRIYSHSASGFNTADSASTWLSRIHTAWT